jgi:hypothetical protein
MSGTSVGVRTLAGIWLSWIFSTIPAIMVNVDASGWFYIFPVAPLKFVAGGSPATDDASTQGPPMELHRLLSGNWWSRSLLIFLSARRNGQKKEVTHEYIHHYKTLRPFLERTICLRVTGAGGAFPCLKNCLLGCGQLFIQHFKNRTDGWLWPMLQLLFTLCCSFEWNIK